MYKLLSHTILAVSVLLILASGVSAQTIMSGEVTDVIDGKTIMLMASAGQIKIELQFIDVPETGQQFHDVVKMHLRDLIFGKIVDYRPRLLYRDHSEGLLLLKGVDISQQMLRDGAAWHLPSKATGQESADFDIYESSQSAARSESRGIWSVKGLQPPWEIRDQEREREEKSRQESYGATGRDGFKAGKNPNLGDIGVLVQGYDAISGTGYVGTSMLPISLGKEREEEQRIFIDLTYFYKEDDKKTRKGMFVVSVVFLTKRPRFITNGDLWVLGIGKNMNLGKPKRTTFTTVNWSGERLSYEIGRSAIQRLATYDGVYMKLGANVIKLTGGRYIYYNLLQVTKQ